MILRRKGGFLWRRGIFITHLEEAVLLYVGQLSIVCHCGSGPRIMSGPRDGKTVLAAASPSRLLRRPLADISAASEGTPLYATPDNNPFQKLSVFWREDPHAMFGACADTMSVLELMIRSGTRLFLF
ncbi:hypothetical protein TNCT_544591 [Trichonephila clavata]|uniref:Uncharacterized protein n=1 Tax=Trichonephila clavata TaxID=2740835 RepID=A0A8X6L5H6_TRICU|nr:hypothetical protein TNCT_544591 [Trichonephila clavata]